MTRPDQERLAAELARECHDAMNVKIPGTIWEGPGPELFREILAKHILRGLASPSTRLAAAERAVIDSAVAWNRHQLNIPALTSKERKAWRDRNDEMIRVENDAVERLVSLREQLAAEECGAVCNVQSRLTPGGVPRGDDVRCHLARGHDGDHEGVGASYRWRA